MGYICSTRMVTISGRVHGDFNRCTCTYLLYNSGSPINVDCQNMARQQQRSVSITETDYVLCEVRNNIFMCGIISHKRIKD